MTMTWQRIREHLIASGAMTENGTTRAAKPRLCDTCNAPVLIGFDDDVAARPCRVDPVPLSPLAEALALLAGRYTVAMVHTRGRYELGYRDAGRIRWRPAGTGRYDVYAEHVCGTSPNWPTLPSAFVNPTTTDLPAGSPAPF